MFIAKQMVGSKMDAVKGIYYFCFIKTLEIYDFRRNVPEIHQSFSAVDKCILVTYFLTFIKLFSVLIYLAK